jgi:hypothetical protein
VAAVSLLAVVEPTAKPTATSTANQTRLLNVVRLNARFMLSLMITGLGEVPVLAETAV